MMVNKETSRSLLCGKYWLGTKNLEKNSAWSLKVRRVPVSIEKE